ncbi:MAG TPA: serine hydrolase domain-containing protein [Pyrinomonadaceae bacterium]|nr:serine hydrolase domain-containing protein [Pyrinomonadaceae bacterium]
MSFRRSVAALLLVIVACGAAMSVRADAVDDYVSAQIRARHVPGLSLAVVREGRLVKAQGYGLANIELNVAATPETVYEVGSLTKQFTAAAVLLLVEEGKVSLEERLAKYLGETASTAWGDVTIRQLLTHTSGIREFSTLPGFELSKRLTPEQLDKAIAALPSAFPAGTSWQYSNTNYYLLGRVVERASGQRFDEFLEARIFKPLGMKATLMADPRRIIPQRASGYQWREGAWVNRDDAALADTFAAAGLASNVLDLARWETALDARRLLKPESFEQMWQPARLATGKSYPYGMGWSVGTFRGRRLLEHGGLMGGFSSYVARFTEERLSVIVLCNLGNIGVSGNAAPIARGVARLYIPTLALAALKELADPDPQTTGALREALLATLAGRPDPSSFTPQSYAFQTSERGRALHRSISSHGALRSLALVERKEEGDERTYLYRAVFGAQTLYISFRLTGAGKISFLGIEED